MFLQFWRIMWWFLRGCALLWFLFLPALSIFGWLSPWPEAEQKLGAEGVSGFKFTVGVASDSYWHQNGTWSEERQRSYVVLPVSARTMEIFTYVESKGSHMAGVDRELVRSRMVIQLLVSWVLAGWLVASTVISWRKNVRAKLQTTVTATSS